VQSASIAPQNVILFEPDLSETTTIARAQEFADVGFRPIVLGFRRARYNRHYSAPWPEIELGRTEDARYWRRVQALLGALPAILRCRVLFKSGALFLARNLDQLVLAIVARGFFNRRIFLIYEVVDIHPTLTRNSLSCRFIRMIERLCLKRVSLVVVSSPAFLRDYFAAVQGYRGEWTVVENKLRLPRSEVTYAVRQRERVNRPLLGGKRWVIGYFGLIRGQATIELIVRLARRLPDRIEFRFRGVLTTVDEKWFRQAIAQARNISYGGEFTNPADLADLYGSVDLAWALDLENTESNSRWLLPCRFYESGLFGVPCIAVRDFEIGALIKRLDVGWTFDHPLDESLYRFFSELTRTSYEEKRRKLIAYPTETFVANGSDDTLVRKLRKLGWPTVVGD